MKKIPTLILCIFFTLITFNVFAVQTNVNQDFYWKILENASLSFDKGNYGDCLKYAISAKELRRQESEWSVSVLEKALKPIAVQKIGDNLSVLLETFVERQNQDAILVVQKMLELHSVEYFNNSMENLINHLKKMENYPEAEYLIGQVYVIEGEYNLALDYYKSAWANSDIFDIPDVKYDILYSMADLSRLSNNLDDYEKALLAIIADDTMFNDGTGNSNYIIAAKKAVLTGSMNCDKFFMLYRSQSYKFMKAYFLLSQLYFEIGNQEKSMDVGILGALASLTRMHEVIKSRDSEYEYDTIENLFIEVSHYTDIVDWSNKNEVWEGLYYFTSVSSNLGAKVFSQSLFEAMFKACPDLYWQVKAQNQLKEYN